MVTGHESKKDDMGDGSAAAAARAKEKIAAAANESVAADRLPLQNYEFPAGKPDQKNVFTQKRATQAH